MSQAAATLGCMVLDGQLLRRVLVTWLVDAQRPLAVAELVARLDHAGLRVDGRPGKVVSDSLRWEVRRGRVVRVGRGTYVAGSIPRSTAWKIRHQARRALQAPQATLDDAVLDGTIGAALHQLTADR